MVFPLPRTNRFDLSVGRKGASGRGRGTGVGSRRDRPRTKLGVRIDLTNDTYLRLIGGAVLAADPLPGTSEPLDQHDLARLLWRLADTLAGALPKPETVRGPSRTPDRSR